MKIANKLLTRTSIYPVECISCYDMPNLMSNVDFIDRIFFCSRVLYEHIQGYKSGKHYSNKEWEHLHKSLYLYFTRMCSRSTPFEVTATYSFDVIEDNGLNNIIIDNNTSIYKIIDHNLIAYLSHKIMSLPLELTHIRYKINPTLRFVGDYYQYIEYKNKNYNISRIGIVKNLDKFIEKVNVFCTFEMIQELLRDNEIISDIKDQDIIIYLIENKILISDIEYCLYDRDYLNILNKNIDNHPELTRFRSILDYACEATLNLKKIISLDKLLEDCLPHDTTTKEEINVERLFSINLRRNSIVQVNEDYIKQSFVKLISLFDKLHRVKSDTSYDIFKKEFEKRYESAKIPFLEALDPVLGLGYPIGSIKYESELLDGLKPAPEITEAAYSLSDFDKLLFQKISCLNSSENEVILKCSDLNLDIKDVKVMHSSMTIFVQGLKKNNNIFFYYNGMLDDNNRMLIRYSKADKEVRDYLRLESHNISNNHTIEADVLYKTDSRIDNILLTEPIHNYVINCLCEKISCEEFEALELNDLYLLLENGELKLWCESKGAYVIPHMNGVYNYELSDVCYYRFLCDYSRNLNKTHGYFAVSPIIYELFSFIPRVIFENFILIAACWKITRSERIKIEEFVNCDNYKELIDSWRINRGIPNNVLFREVDTHIYVNWLEKVSVMAFLARVKDEKEDIWIHEFLYDSYESIVCDKDNNHYVNELFFKVTQ